jgi:maltooligosyltrehalose trehalohydrolase
MNRVDVWAPNAQTVEIDFSGVRASMQRRGDGWWSTEHTEVRAGVRYSFVLDGSDPVPDPRSAWQPDGVHAASAFVDHSAFPWTDRLWQAGPLSAAIIYEMHVGTFTPEGTFDSAISRLDHLVQLGVTHLELMPVAEFSGDWGWGYDGVDLYAPHSRYGGPDGLKRLVNACHGKGLAVILDVVYNHLGPSGNYLGRFGPYTTSRYATPWGDAVNLDGPMCQNVRRFFVENARMWLRDYHFDALRLDAIHALVDNGAFHFLEELVSEVRCLSAELGRHLFLIAESDLNNPRIIHSTEIGGYGIDAQWSDDFHHALHSVITGETSGYYADFGSMQQLAKALAKAFVYDGAYSPYRKRPHGRPPTGLSAHHFLGYIQNHDQIGNRADGERISHLVNPGRAKIAAALVMTAPFIPMLFQGEEWAASSPFQYFTQHSDEELGKAVSEGRRSEFVDFGWHPHDVPDPQDPGTFERSKLRWDELDQTPHEEIFCWYRDLIRLRRSSPSLVDGRMEVVQTSYAQDAGWICVQRGAVVVVCNLSERSQCVPTPAGRVALASDPSAHQMDCGIRLAPDSVAVLDIGRQA